MTFYLIFLAVMKMIIMKKSNAPLRQILELIIVYSLIY